LGKNVRGCGAKWDTVADSAAVLWACTAKAEMVKATVRKARTLFISTLQVSDVLCKAIGRPVKGVQNFSE